MSKQSENPGGGLNTGQSARLTKYINPRTDFSFNLIFGKEPNKDLLIDLLNGIFKSSKVITELQYNNPVHKGPRKKYRRTVFDLYCTDQDGGNLSWKYSSPNKSTLKTESCFTVQI